MPPEPPGVEPPPLGFRCAHLQLRGPAGPLPARVRWPAPVGSGAPTRPGLLVLVTGAPGDVAPAPGLVVVALDVSSCTFEDALAATQWAADHAEELGADPACLLVGGTGAGEPLAAAVVAHARQDGWPPVRMAGEADGWAS